MNVLVTGGAGFIGSHVVDLLINNGHKVVIVDNLSKGKKEHLHPRATFFDLDICSPDLDRAFKVGIDIVIHLAAQINVSFSVENPSFDAKVNILGTLNVLDCCHKNKVKKIIYATSAAEIGEPQHLPITEDDHIAPLSPYGLSKAGGEEYVKWFGKKHGLSYTIVRYANVYGPRQDNSGEGGVIAIFISNCLSKKSLTIEGTGEQTRDFVYVEDVAEATTSLLEKGLNKKFNVGSGREISILKLAQIIKNLLHNGFPLNFSKKRIGDISKSVFSIHKIKKETGWFPKTSLEEGLKKTILYYEKHH